MMTTLKSLNPAALSSDDPCAGSLVLDYICMNELFAPIEFDAFVQGYEAISTWFASRPVPRSLLRAS
jgi:hypothetical protein